MSPVMENVKFDPTANIAPVVSLELRGILRFRYTFDLIEDNQTGFAESWSGDNMIKNNRQDTFFLPFGDNRLNYAALQWNFDLFPTADSGDYLINIYIKQSDKQIFSKQYTGSIDKACAIPGSIIFKATKKV